MLAFEMSALFSGLTPIPLKFPRNSRAREKDKQIVPLSYQLLFYFIRFAIFWQGLRHCMTQFLLARNSLFPHERPPQRGFRRPLFTNSVWDI